MITGLTLTLDKDPKRGEELHITNNDTKEVIRIALRSPKFHSPRRKARIIINVDKNKYSITRHREDRSNFDEKDSL